MIKPLFKKTLYRSTLAALFFLLAYAAFLTLYQGTSHARTQEIAVKETNENGQKNLKKHLLVITSQPYHTDWFGTLDSSLRKKLFSGLSDDSKISYEYIGSESLTDQDYDIKFTELLREKYARIKLDMVIAVMPVSSQYILDHGDSIFPQMPVVFVLPSKKQIPVISARPHSGLVRSAEDAIPETIQRIHTLLPDTEHLIVVSGSSADDLNYQKITQESLKGKKWPKTAEYLKGLPVAELADRLEKLRPKSAVLILTYLIDRNGSPLTTVQVMKTVSERTSAPIFSFYDTVMGLGIVGGKLTSAEAYGEAAAEAAMKIFTGGPELPLVDIIAESRDIYDWRQIEKWKITEDRLLPASEIRFQPYSFWKENKGKVILALGFIFLQTILILMLLFNLMKRKKAEDALAVSEKKYRSIFDNAVMGIYQTTPEGRFQSVNPALVQLLGYETSEQLLRDINDIQKDVYVNPEDRNQIKKLFEQKDVVRKFEAQFRLQNGSHLWTSISGKAIRDEKGKILYYEGTIEDIDQRKQAEIELTNYRDHLEKLVERRTEELASANERLKISEERFGYALEASKDGLWDWDVQTNKSYVNPAYHTMLGYEPGELGSDTQRQWIDLMHPEDRERVPEIAKQQLETKGAYEIEFRLRTKDGGYKWILSRGKVVARDKNGQPARAVGTHTDMTLYKQMEIELREAIGELRHAKERAESADRLKSAFLATMSHELRTPLNSIIGFTGILLQKLGGPLNEEQTKQLGMVYNSARHLLDLINDVLDISKIEAGQLNVVHERFDLRESIERVMKSSQPLADKKGIEFSSTVAPEIGAITGDRRRVEQILLNLISNAIKFTEQGYVRLQGEVRGEDIVIAVKDTGIGVKQEDMGLLFTAFQQIESGITRKYDGTGLGLSICKKLAQLLGGEIRVESEWGKGSTFSLILKKEG